MKNYNSVRTYFETVLCNHRTENCEITLNITDVKITATYEDENYMGFDAKSTSVEGHCKHCDQVISKVKDYKNKLYNHGKIQL